MTESSRERPPHDTADPQRRPAPIGKGGTPNVAGGDEQRPEIAEGPVPGVGPGEDYARPEHRAPLDVDPPPRDGPGYGTDGQPPVWEPGTGPRGHDPGAPPEDEGIPDLQDGSPSQQWSGDPQVQAVPGDAPVAVESFGTTGAEQAAGESLDARLAQEEPEADEVAGSPEPAAGRLDPLDPHSDLRAAAVPDDTAGLSAEEESVRIRRDDAEREDTDQGHADREGTAPGGAEDRTEWPGIETPEEVEGATGREDAEGDVPGIG
ncbi:hypothetical protein GCM10009639_24630 [Kitasatospora putterlickiae]|uniref:DUF5709 domain-containing protein n=1 Tax=Kitasatospora putterlickiae TaxID=221725 RepID=A0ABP4IQK6_9ACTN